MLTVDEFRSFLININARFDAIRADIARLNERIGQGGFSPEDEAEIRSILESVQTNAASIDELTPEA